ncbi:MAG: DUF1156 domain-containing protein, partial [candidate division KSB1 bacterium]|nr:DUF1156 domain-containing protein [candidate division KSB1 bacterium]
NGVAGALEEDARLTALFLWTLQSSNGPQTSPLPEGEGDDNEPEEDDEQDAGRDAPSTKPKGFLLVFDVVRRFAQPLGIDLPKWEGRIIETEKGVVRLLAVSERAKQLFGEKGVDEIEERQFTTSDTNATGWFPGFEPEEYRPRAGGRRIRISEEAATHAGVTTLDRVHAAMLLQASGRTNALRALLKAEQERGPEFLRLANALSALYPSGCEEKRLLDAMLLAVPR